MFFASLLRLRTIFLRFCIDGVIEGEVHTFATKGENIRDRFFLGSWSQMFRSLQQGQPLPVFNLEQFKAEIVLAI